MQTTYRMKASELDERFVAALRALYQDREIEIMVQDGDETAYLLGTPANRERLLQARDDVAAGRNLVVVPMEP